jgi:hypothetical protein
VSLTPGQSYRFKGDFNVPAGADTNSLRLSLDYWDRNNEVWVENASREILTDTLIAGDWKTVYSPSFVPPEKPEVTGDYELYFCISCNTAQRVTCNQLTLKAGTSIPEWDYAAREEEACESMARSFAYRISDFYDPMATNNTVLLKIVDKYQHAYSVDKTFTF